ncbi:MAG TPA: UDP-N-acetylmuramoyl-L-alanine--D-glutamate ligase [Pirellulales bacterium]|nr:UDP-N-acetylmuramoyl-L-alanine--D-glutamate ligase [Pirellulales bacterium]
MEFHGRRVTVMGLGRHGGGVAAARWLAKQGAIVTVTDVAPAEALADSVAALADVPVARWRLAGHDQQDFDDAETIVVNPAVRPGHPLVERARQRGATITSELELFLRRCPGRMMGVTGSNGKSTTTAMIAAILQRDGRQAFLGGNIGRSLLDDLDAMTPESWSVLEISSFQLTWLSDDCPLPKTGVLTNFTPNHLDWHGTIADYTAAKRRLFCGPQAAKTAILGSPRKDFDSGGNADIRGRVLLPLPVADIPPLNAIGDHNRANAACAAAAAHAVGCSAAAIDAALRAFTGLEHRLELIGTIAGRAFYNDSMATTPESTAAALAAFSGRAWLLAGGYDKRVDMAALTKATCEHARGAAFYGAIGPRLHAELAVQMPGERVSLHETLDAAFDWCFRQSRTGDCILLSPGCASYDQFADYRARGARFRSLVGALARFERAAQ